MFAFFCTLVVVKGPIWQSRISRKADDPSSDDREYTLSFLLKWYSFLKVILKSYLKANAWGSLLFDGCLTKVLIEELQCNSINTLHTRSVNFLPEWYWDIAPLLFSSWFLACSYSSSCLRVCFQLSDIATIEY